MASSDRKRRTEIATYIEGALNRPNIHFGRLDMPRHTVTRTDDGTIQLRVRDDRGTHYYSIKVSKCE